jgi:hypothetical protein
LDELGAEALPPLDVDVFVLAELHREIAREVREVGAGAVGGELEGVNLSELAPDAFTEVLTARL